MPNPVSPIPANYRSLTPVLACRKAAEAIEFYKAIFGAVVTVQMPGPNGSVMHAELKIGDSTIFVGDPMSKIPPAVPAPGQSNPVTLYLYVSDVDDVFKRAQAAGARVDMPLQDMFWGDRCGTITDLYGQQWQIATHKEDVAPDEMQRRQKTFFAKAGG